MKKTREQLDRICWYKKNWNRWKRNNPNFPPDPEFFVVHQRIITKQTPTSQKEKERIIERRLTRAFKKKKGRCSLCESILKTKEEKDEWKCWWCIKRSKTNGN